MNNALTAAILSFSLMFSGAALSDTTKPFKHAKTKVDTMTTQSIKNNTPTNCFPLKSALNKNQICATTDKYPVNALSGMNLGF